MLADDFTPKAIGMVAQSMLKNFQAKRLKWLNTVMEKPIDETTVMTDHRVHLLVTIDELILRHQTEVEHYGD